MATVKANPELQAICDAWNAKYKEGAMVSYEEIVGEGETFRGRTKSEAQVLSGRTAVIWLEGKSGCVSLDHCTPVADDEAAVEAKEPVAANSLLRPEELQPCLSHEPGSVIRPGESSGYLISVVVGAGVMRERTVATLFRVFGNGDRMAKEPRCVEEVAGVLDSFSDDLLQMAAVVAATANEYKNCTVLVDVSGLGAQFIKILERLGLKLLVRSRLGERPNSSDYRKRFLNLRAQCNVHAVEAVKDRRVTLNPASYDRFATKTPLPCHFDELGRYLLTPRAEMAEEDLVLLDQWDPLAMVFLEHAAYVAASADMTPAAPVLVQHISLEDRGQDFTEWYVRDGIVIDCQPFQGRTWVGTQIVEGQLLEPGSKMSIIAPNAGHRVLDYAIKAVETLSPSESAYVVTMGQKWAGLLGVTAASLGLPEE
jgi:hypothetical protein